MYNNIKRQFRSVDDVLGAGFLTEPRLFGDSDRVLRSTRLEDKLYSELRAGDSEMDAIETSAMEKLASFNALSRDVYQSFYSLGVRRREDDELTDAARLVHSPILEDMMNGDEYPTIKSICDGRRLPAYEAAKEFTETIAANLDGLLDKVGGDKGALKTLERAKAHEERLQNELKSLLEQRASQGSSPELDRKIIDKANKTSSKAQQIEAIAGQVQQSILRNQAGIGDLLTQAAQAAQAKAEETALTMAVWGDGDDTAPEKLAQNRELMERIRQSETLKEITPLLGRFKEMMAKARKNDYAYGRGEKYTLETGNHLSRVLTSEFTLLAVPETISLFLQKYQGRKLLQYKRREAVYKGNGDIIMCLDESGSTREDAPWGKAVALALLDAAMAGNRKFALVHFSSRNSFKTDLFIPGKYAREDVFAAAETFLGGGTNFKTPLREALRLMEQEGFENADIVFVTDGECELDVAFQAELKQAQAARKFTVTGVLLDAESPGMAFSLDGFCTDTYRTSELARDGIAEAVLGARR